VVAHSPEFSAAGYSRGGRARWLFNAAKMDFNIKQDLDKINQLEIEQEKAMKDFTIGEHKFSGEEKGIEKLRELLEGKDVVVEDFEDFETNKGEHEKYDFEKFIDKAKEYSDMLPPDVVQFSEKAWGAASICVVEFYLKHFKNLIKSHSAKRKLLQAICAGLDRDEAFEVGSTWKDAERSHSNFYNMDFVAKPERDALLDSIEKMADLIQKANVEDVKTKLDDLKRLGTVDFRKNRGKFQIGKTIYEYDYVISDL